MSGLSAVVVNNSSILVTAVVICASASWDLFAAIWPNTFMAPYVASKLCRSTGKLLGLVALGAELASTVSGTILVNP